MNDEDTVLKALGFIVIQFTPMLWRIRGDVTGVACYMDWWPLLKKYKVQYSYDKKALAYEHDDDIYAIVKKHLTPFETPSDGEAAAIIEWQKGLDELRSTIPSAHLAIDSTLR